MDMPDTTYVISPSMGNKHLSSSCLTHRLRGLIDHPPVGGADFLPLNGQALLGFRLVPGSLPEQYRMDPTLPSSVAKHHHKKKKRHKHKTIDKTDNGASDQAPASVNTQAAPDAFLFIHPDMSPNPPLHTPSHGSHLPVSTALPSAVPSKVPHPYNVGVPPAGGCGRCSSTVMYSHLFAAGTVITTPAPGDVAVKKRKVVCGRVSTSSS